MARIRTFLAFDLGKPIRDHLLALQETLTPLLPDARWVEQESLHLTILFLGEVDDRDLLAVCRAAQNVTATLPKQTISVEGMGCFPNLRRPRVLWMGIGKGRDMLCELHDALEAPLLELGCYRREERQFTPHVTLARFKSDPPEDVLAGALDKYQNRKAGEVTVKELLVMSSEQSSKGSTYTVMSRAKFTGSD